MVTFRVLRDSNALVEVSTPQHFDSSFEEGCVSRPGSSRRNQPGDRAPR
jgi:hypothetical protein